MARTRPASRRCRASAASRDAGTTPTPTSNRSSGCRLRLEREVPGGRQRRRARGSAIRPWHRHSCAAMRRPPRTRPRHPGRGFRYRTSREADRLRLALGARMTVTAKAVIEAFYGSAPRSYLNGCSTGGRQALIEARDFRKTSTASLRARPRIRRRVSIRGGSGWGWRP